MPQTGLQFIGSNPFTEAYQKGVRLEDERARNAAALAQAEMSMAKQEALAPAEVSQAFSQADLSKTQAIGAKQKMPHEVRQSKTTADRGEHDLDTSRKIDPHRITQAGAQARSSVSDANVAERTEGTRVEQAGATLAQTRAATDQTKASTKLTKVQTRNAELQGFFKAMDAISQGRPDLAQAIAAETGGSLPPQLLNDANTQRVMTQYWTQVQAQYPHSPEKQFKAMTQLLAGYLTAQQPAPGQPATGSFRQAQETGMPAPEPAPPQPLAFDPTKMYTTPGMPSPPDQDPRWFGRSGAGKAPAQQQMIEYMVRQGIAPDPTTAWQMMQTSKHDPMARARMITALTAKLVADPMQTGTPQQKADLARSLVDDLLDDGATGLSQFGATPAPGAPAPAARPPAGPAPAPTAAPPPPAGFRPLQ